MQILLYILFILSGAAGLMYESVWSRYLSLFVGHSAYAQIIVLTIFLGGMSLGALLVGRWSRRVAEPLAWYAYIEMAAGLLGLAFHSMFSAVSQFSYNSIFPALADSPMLIVVKWLIAALLILPQSILLGTTFPLMSAGVIRFVRNKPGRVLSLLYFANSLGAAIGVLLAGFIFIRMAGLPGTLTVAAIINIVVGVAALAATRYLLPMSIEREERKRAESEWLDGNLTPSSSAVVAEAPDDVRRARPAVPAIASDSTLWRLLLAVSFGTAVASFIYEIAWIRMLSLVLGSATHSFELMLSAFILGLSLGAFWVRKRADLFADPIAALGKVQWLMGAAALATLPVYLASFGWTATLMSAVDRNDAGYAIFTIARYAFCLAVMLPSTFLAGITLPLITRTLFKTERGESAIGTVYGVNTLGSIVGVAAAGLVLMPLLGVKYLLIFGAALDMALGVALLAHTGRGFQISRPRAAASALLLLGVVALATLTTDFDRTMLSSGVFRTGSVPVRGSRNIVYYKDGRTASVSVNRSLGDSLTVISTNGKPDASLDAPWFRSPDSAVTMRFPLASDVSTQLLLPMVTLAHVPQARVAAVIGHGSGMSSHFLLGSPTIERLYTIEIEPAMIEGSKQFLPANRRVHEDPRSHMVVDDAKSYFAATTEKFDLILSEPSNPWVSGVSGLFTAEFYSRIRRYLTDDGVFGQWLHLYEINDGLVLSVLAALHQNFPAYEIFQTSSGDILIVASMSPALRTPDWSVFEFPGIRDDLRHATPFDSLTLEATRVLSREVLAPLLDDWEDHANSDYFPILDLGAERARFQREVAGGFSSMWQQGFNVAAAFMGRRAGAHDDNLAVMPGLGTIFSRALSARARKGRPVSNDEMEIYPGLDDFIYREWAFLATLASPTAPDDWHRWAVEFVDIEEDLHRGTSGFVDTSFYDAVTRFAERHNAPDELIWSIQFLRGVAEWDYETVSKVADQINALEPGARILSTDFFLDAGAVAKLKLGDIDGAREFYDSLISYANRSPVHFQSRLLYAHLRAAEKKRLEGLVTPAAAVR